MKCSRLHLKITKKKIDFQRFHKYQRKMCFQGKFNHLVLQNTFFVYFSDMTNNSNFILPFLSTYHYNSALQNRQKFNFFGSSQVDNCQTSFFITLNQEKKFPKILVISLMLLKSFLVFNSFYNHSVNIISDVLKFFIYHPFLNKTYLP